MVKAMVFPVVTYSCESWNIKKAEHQRIGAFELSCWRRLLRVPWTARKSTLNTHCKDWCWSWSSNILVTWCEQPTHWKRPWCWERLKAEEKRVSEDEKVEWHYWCSGHELGQTLEDVEGQGGLACYSPWGCKESDTTSRLNNINHNNRVWVCVTSWSLHFSDEKTKAWCNISTFPS